MMKLHRLWIYTQRIKIQKGSSRKHQSKRIHQNWKHLSMTVELLSLGLSLKFFLTVFIFILYVFFLKNHTRKKTPFYDLHRLKLKFERKHISMTIRAAGGLGLYLLVNGTQQLCKPVEGLELPADPHKIQPLQPELCPAVPGWTAAWWGRRRKHEHEWRGLQLLMLIYWHHYSQQSVEHTGERSDSDTAGHTQADIIVEHVLWWTAEGTVHVNPARFHKTRDWCDAQHIPGLATEVMNNKVIPSVLDE